MNKKDRVLKAIEALPEVKRILVTGEVPLDDAEHMIQMCVYLDNERDPAPRALGVHASDGVGTSEKLG